MILIAGPTASGKSQLGIEIARQCKGVVINADSMQVYNVLHLLTARPDKDERAGVPHYLYGFVNPSETFSTGHWLEAVRVLLQRPELKAKTCVFVGGTGLYFRALLGGLARVPPVEPAIREKWLLFLKEKGIGPLYQCLAEKDSVMAQRLLPGDGQRILRALEVWEATGRSLAEWQRMGNEPLVDAIRTRRLVLMPERDHLAARINARFDTMVEKGALEEARQLRAMHLDPALPAMKAIGVREFSAFLDGATSLEAAIEGAKAETRRYAKRQMTWLRHQLDESWQQFSSVQEALHAFSPDTK